MRKDLQIGMAIGGVLLLVLIVYAMIPSKPAAKNGAGQQVAQTNQANDSANGSLGGPTDSALTGATGGASPASNTKEPAAPQPGPVASGEGSNVGGVNMDEPHDLPAGTENPAGPATTASGGDKDWNKLLNDAPLMTKTPSPSSAGGSSSTESDRFTPPSAEKRQAATESADPSLAAHQSSSVVDPFGAGPDAKRDAASGKTNGSASGSPASSQTHQVREGETYSSIAKAAYGSDKYASVIQKANPNIDPRRLKPGMTITLPDAASVKSAVASASPKNTPPSLSATEKPIDSATEYRVQSGDTLERIARKRYGSPTMKDEIYRLNEKTIGPDENRLKLNMVLKMPPNPGAAVPAAAHTSAH